MTQASGPPERARQTVHIAMGGWALLLRYLTWWQTALLGAVALAFNAFVLPHLGGRRLYRGADHVRGYSAGMLFYPLAVVLLALVFPRRLDIVAAAWGILAAGDGMATLVGRLADGRRIPWNREKSVAGTAGFVLFGGAAGVALAWWCRPGAEPLPPAWFSLSAPVVAAVVAALVETVPIRLDDNVTVPAIAAATLWTISLMSGDLLSAAAGRAASALPLAVMVNVVVAWLGHRARTVSTSGAVGAAIIGTIISIASGWQGWGLLMLTFVLASVASRIGLRRKTLMNIAEERGGRRSVGNAIANTGVAAVAAIVAITSYSSEAALVAFVAALTAAGSDTIASEIGKAFGRRTYLARSFARVPPGTPGALSLEGTVAGLAGAAVLAMAGISLGLARPSALVAIVAGATLGAFVESVLSATFEHRGFVNNDVLNFVNTVIAVAAAVPLAGFA